MSVITKKQAEVEINSWLSSQDISPEQREAHKLSIAKIVDGVVNGRIIVDSEKTMLTLVLKFPIGTGEFATKELKFKSEIEVGDVQNRLVGAAPGDRYASVFAHIAAATGEAVDVVRKMNMKDFNFADSIVVFFMV